MNNFYNPYFTSNNIFTGYYVSDYNEVLSKPTPMSGEAVVFVDLEKNMLWSKKIQGNIPCVQAYRITPLYQDGQPPQTQINNSQDIMEEIKALKAEMAILRGEHNDK